MGLLLIAAVILVAGVSVMVVGARRSRTAAGLREGARAEATIVDTKTDWTPMLFDPLGGPATRPVVRFQPADGPQVQTRAATPPGLFRVGDAVVVRYDPRRPSHAQLDSWVSNGGNGAILLVGGCALTVIAALLTALNVATM